LLDSLLQETYYLKMNIGNGTSVVAILKKKMLDTKEEVEKVKESIQDMSRIIQVEIEGKETALGEVNKLEEKLAFMEEDLAKKRDMIREANDKTTELGKESEESLRIARVLKNKTSNEDVKVALLEKELEQAVFIEREAEAKYEEVIRKLDIVESKLGNVEKRADSCEEQKSKLEEDLRVLCSSLKSVECSKDKASSKEEAYNDKIKIMTAKCKEVEGRAEVSERAVGRLQDEVDRLEGTLEEVVIKNKKAEEEMESVFQDLRNM